jgi:alcohol dehydrogenase
MQAVLYDAFRSLPRLTEVADPVPEPHGVVIGVRATGVCRSDWHGWMGHDPDIRLPHVPGHELAGIVEAAGRQVTRWHVGDRVTLPFVCGCGECEECRTGNHQVCQAQFQPGFTHWGSFAPYVSIHRADVNLVRLPDAIDFITAASLGCRYATSFRAVVDQGRTSAGEWVAVHGCGGVGLSAVQIAAALGAQVIAVDISEEKLSFARSLGATATVNARAVPSVVEAVVERTRGGAHVSIEALGNPATCFDSIGCLRRRGRHVQVGLMLGEHSTPQIPMATVIAHELELRGSHGMPAHRYGAMLSMIEAGRLAPARLVGRTITLEQSIEALTSMDRFEGVGVTVVTEFLRGRP